MLIVYASKTGNIERFLKKTGLTHVLKISDGTPATANTTTTTTAKDFLGNPSISANSVLNGSGDNIAENFILLTYTTGIGEVPAEVVEFMRHNHSFAKGIIGSGNKNWGGAFCNATTLLSQQYNIPILMQFEMSGNIHDVKEFLRVYEGL